MNRFPNLRLSTWLVAAAVAALAPSCGSDDSPSNPGNKQLCQPGSTQPCTGPAACQGGQTCTSDGKSWGSCDCGAAGSGGGGAGGVDAVWALGELMGPEAALGVLEARMRARAAVELAERQGWMGARTAAPGPTLLATRRREMPNPRAPSTTRAQARRPSSTTSTSTAQINAKRRTRRSVRR